MTESSRYYAGIGSRETPETVLDLMTKVSTKLENEGWVLRSGGADGADSAFEMGVSSPENKQIFIPSTYFNGRSNRHPGCYYACDFPAYPEARESVSKFHPAPERLSEYAYKLMARNAMQVLGPDLATHSRFVVAWTKGGKVSGGTGQALRIANHYHIPIFNLGNKELELATRSFLSYDGSKPSLEAFILSHF